MKFVNNCLTLKFYLKILANGNQNTVSGGASPLTEANSLMQIIGGFTVDTLEGNKEKNTYMIQKHIFLADK